MTETPRAGRARTNRAYTVATQLALAIMIGATISCSSDEGRSNVYSDHLVEIDVQLGGEAPFDDTCYFISWISPDDPGTKRQIDIMVSEDAGAVKSVSLTTGRELIIMDTGQVWQIKFFTGEEHWTLFDLDRDGGMDVMVNPNQLRDGVREPACVCYMGGAWRQGWKLGGAHGYVVEVDEKRFRFENDWSRDLDGQEGKGG